MNRRDAAIAEAPERIEPDQELNELSGAVVGAAIDVHKVLGPGCFESVYEEAMCVELRRRGISFARQVHFAVDYKGEPVGEGRVDLVVAESLVVELKAVDAFASIHTAQVISYLKATRRRLALLINFNVPVLKEGIKRVVLSH